MGDELLTKSSIESKDKLCCANSIPGVVKHSSRFGRATLGAPTGQPKPRMKQKVKFGSHSR